MTISPNDYDQLHDAGFIDEEIRMFAEAKTPDGRDQPMINLESPVWQAAMLSRFNKIRNLRDSGRSRGLPEDLINENIHNLLYRMYNRGKASPWDWLKIEYVPVQKKDYITFVRQRALRRTRIFRMA